jgi:phage virion morphogenesis protein
MAGAKFSITAENADEIRGQLNRLISKGQNLIPVFQDIGEMLLISHDQRFRDQVSPDGQPWEPLSPKYQERKEKHQDTILTLNSILSGQLSYAATNSDLFFGTNTEYGAIHQFGGSEGMRPSNAAIPARPWLGITDEDTQEIFEILGDFLLES